MMRRFTQGSNRDMSDTLTLDEIEEARRIVDAHPLPRDPFAGLEVILSERMVRPERVRRTWRERLLSWPWRPWDRYRNEWVPDTTRVIQMGNKLVMHPVMARILRENDL